MDRVGLINYLTNDGLDDLVQLDKMMYSKLGENWPGFWREPWERREDALKRFGKIFNWIQYSMGTDEVIEAMPEKVRGYLDAVDPWKVLQGVGSSLSRMGEPDENGAYRWVLHVSGNEGTADIEFSAPQTDMSPCILTVLHDSASHSLPQNVADGFIQALGPSGYEAVANLFTRGLHASNYLKTLSAVSEYDRNLFKTVSSLGKQLSKKPKTERKQPGFIARIARKIAGESDNGNGHGGLKL